MDTSNSSNESGSKKGLEGTGLSLPVNSHGNLKSVHDDNELKDLLKHLKATKTPDFIIKCLKRQEQNILVSIATNLEILNGLQIDGCLRCGVCRDILPTFCNLSNDYPNSVFVYADVDECPEVTKDVRYTPTFRFFRDGAIVDEFYGAGQQRLRDRAWLHF